MVGMRRMVVSTKRQATSRARVLAVTLMLIMVASLLALIREAINPRVGSVPEQLLFAGLVFVPFLAYLALAIQVHVLLRRSKDSLEAMPRRVEPSTTSWGRSVSTGRCSS